MMSSKEQTHSNEKTGSKQRGSRLVTENMGIAAQPEIHPTTILQRARLDPSLLAPNEVRRLQRTLGNQTVGRLLAQAAQPQPMPKEASTGLKSALPNTIIQRQVLSKIISTKNEQNIYWILEVVIGGRTPSPFPGTMGAHSTAWIAHTDAVRRMLVNTEFAEGAANIIWLAEEELKSSPLLELKEFLSEQHNKRLEETQKELKESIESLGEEKGKESINPVRMIQLIRQLINRYLTYVNYLPMSTVKGGDPSGHGEGSARSNISTFEYLYANSLLESEAKKVSEPLSNDIKTLSSKGIQGKIKAGAEKRFGIDKTPIDQSDLKKVLIQELWSLFAAETPGIFAQGKEDKLLLIWQKSLHNFLKTIKIAYPHAYDFTKMQTIDSQKIGLQYALAEVKITVDSETLEKLLPGYQEEAEFRETHDEVTQSDLKQSGSGFLVTILLDEDGIVGDVNLIGEVQMIGRTKSPFSNTMGAHTTAWAAHLDAVRNILTGKNVFEAITTLQSRAEEAMQDEGLDLSHKISEKHQVYLLAAYNTLQALKGEVASYETKELDQQVAFLEQYIFEYLTFVNFLPLSTIETGSVPGGLSEGKHRTFLLNYERLGMKVFGKEELGTEEKQKILQEHIFGLFDKKGLGAFPPDLGERDKTDFEYHVGKPFTEAHHLYEKFFPPTIKKKSPKKGYVAYKRFYKTMLEAYPRAMIDSGIKEDIATEVWQSTTKGVIKEESKKLEEILHMNNCLINAIKQAAFGEGAEVTIEELLEIRQRIGQIGTMLFATERTISIICDVLKINQGIVVIYRDRPSEDFGDTSTDPLLIEHTGFFHFRPYKTLLQVGIPESKGGNFNLMLPFSSDKFMPILQLHVEDIFTSAPMENNFFNLLPRMMREGTHLSVLATFEGDTEMEEEIGEIQIEGTQPLIGMPPLLGQENRLLLQDAVSPSINSKKRNREETRLQLSRKKLKKLEINFWDGAKNFVFDFSFSKEK